MARRKAPAARVAKAAAAAPLLPDHIEPMQAQANVAPFDSEQHLFEIKWDGTRCIAFFDCAGLRLQNRRDNQMLPRYPELECLRELPNGVVLDGEIVVLQGGKPSFARLQQREQLQSATRVEILTRRLPATLMAFDLLYERGASLMNRPLHERCERLRELIGGLHTPHVLCPDFVVGPGRQYFEAAAAHGLEGIMAKRLDSPYTPGKRSPHWSKIRVAQTGTFEIIGFTPHETDPRAIGALIIGEPAGRKWSYKGKVGSGLTAEQRGQLYELLQPGAVLKPPPRNGPADAEWRLPGYRCVVQYFEKTGIGMLRAPVFKGLVK